MLIIALPLYIIAIELGIILYVYFNNKKSTESINSIEMTSEAKEDFKKADQQATETFNSIIANLNAFMLDKEVDTSAEQQDI